MEKRIQNWWAEFSKKHGIDTRYVREEAIIDEYYECHPEEGKQE